MPSFPRPETTVPYRIDGLADLLPEARELDFDLTGVSLAADAVEPGDLFAALPGTNRHGAEFCAQAAERGAVAVLTDERGAALAAGTLPVLVAADPRTLTGEIAARVWGNPSEHVNLIGITGTNGKTSTAYLVEAGLAYAKRTTAIIGTVETRIAGERIKTERTTPEAPELQALLAIAVERGVENAVMEVSSHALALGRVAGCRFKAVGFTMFGTDHLDFHADLDDYFAAKAKLFDGRAEHEILNADDPRVATLADGINRTFSLQDPTADHYAHDIAGDGFTQTFEYSGPKGSGTGRVNMPGRHNVANAVLAVALLETVCIGTDVALAGVASCTGVPGRMELVSGDGPVRGVVDYAHKPEAITAVLEALRDSTPGKVIAILGAGGDRDRSKRPLMGAAAARAADLVIVTDDNPRTEDPARIRDEVAAAVQGVPCRNIPGRETAVHEAAALAAPGDTIALLGKGHETVTETAAGPVAGDDRELLARALRDAAGVKPAHDVEA
ncbi:UDP-N-acetylmuramoyl-L-alanyl-D-glutamate--2,6-diaminopimelate ligase [Glycomyces algeriensis]|uniref:UDP-N-acetylmuramoyl-L-alanyl-D-glutamate--2,6-diaminopimelate ligase n=1 Tax=Glycomyces algeriensis TaxID=256037 RepID=A0A9W6G8X3_9ACTN|nr:UDP-N-acetylmuramoyl-L-alanyl-D-glutamate--2,6-diaminopimelate ligase [Glycomyces algeriensis]MDA1365173.1 UDP-N-acetylmuramoyl-L-alanyl-D-glutamate--2,6-diaminopimelate ligase [Glycomyces algeriensis]MDR7349763.1 UDP-N-acetylmuramoyl-L-alanyl-D-glutamate--2,6-diaminopimelate ligase [Glycomyces algeriensis]GLI42472.1 UDP-N-acetylmuramoyl-L-alanyl-D-glutamate--2,6-diaminopimelate ligase [Glycomyces algeriensis]